MHSEWFGLLSALQKKFAFCFCCWKMMAERTRQMIESCKERDTGKTVAISKAWQARSTTCTIHNELYEQIGRAHV